jgi:hypothetical protein
MDGSAPSEENFEILSIDDRLVHKVSQPRSESYASRRAGYSLHDIPVVATRD